MDEHEFNLSTVGYKDRGLINVWSCDPVFTFLCLAGLNLLVLIFLYSSSEGISRA